MTVGAGPAERREALQVTHVYFRPRLHQRLRRGHVPSDTCPRECSEAVDVSVVDVEVSTLLQRYERVVDMGVGQKSSEEVTSKGQGQG